jgi:23S rRNA (guanosine2251-2'-O)-methyltransferase
MGRNCVEELVRHAPSRIVEVYLAELVDEGRGGRRRDDLQDGLNHARIPIKRMQRRELDALAGSDSHQGVVAKVKPRPSLDLEQFIKKSQSVGSSRVLAMDGVLDPHNFGALLRASECFGVHAVLWSKNRSAPLGPVTAKVSVGASELVPLVPVANLARALEGLKEAGYWLVGAVMGPDAASLDTFEFPEKCVIVVGSEGAGLHHLTEQLLDFKVVIPMMGKISSLNVSQATAIMLNELARQHRLKVT